MRRKESKEEGREIKDNIAEKYSKVSRPISRFSKWISAWMDRILFSQRYGKLVALLLAVFVYAVINIGDSASSLFETKQVYTFKAQRSAACRRRWMCSCWATSTTCRWSASRTR